MKSSTSAATTNPAAPGSRRRVRWLIAAAGSVVVTIGVVAVTAGSGPPAASKASTGVPGKAVRSSLDQYEVTRGDFEITTTATGDLRAKNQIEIRNTLESETTIVEIVAEGTSVTRGDVLVKLNAETIQQRLDEEALALETARASVVEATEAYEIQVSENESSKRAAELKLQLAQLDLDKWRQGEVESKRQELDHALERAEKEEARLREYLDRSRVLYEKNFYSRDKLQTDELNLEQAVAATEKARLAKDIYWEFEYPRDQKQKVSAVEEATAEVERVLRQNASRLVSKDADRRNKQQSLAIREQKFNKYKEQIDAATVKAPSDGLVVYATSLDNARWGGDEGPLQVGSKVWPNQTLIVLPDTSVMMANVKVHESIAGRIRPGQPASIKIDAMGDYRFTGRVESVGILAEATNRWQDPTLREYTVRVALDIPRDMIAAGNSESASGSAAPRQGLRPSMRCEAEIVLGKVADVVTVPIQSVHSEGLLRFVYVADASGARFTRRPVLPGQRSDKFAEIRAGLNPGERVLLRKPDAGEIVGKGAAGWDPQELAAVGLEVNASGDIVPSAAALAARGAAGGGGRGGRGNGGGAEGMGGAGARRAGGPPAARAQPGDAGGTEESPAESPGSAGADGESTASGGEPGAVKSGGDSPASQTETKPDAPTPAK